MDRRIAAPDEGSWGRHRPVPLMPMESATSFLGRLALAKAAPSTMAFCADQGLRHDDLRLGRPEAVARLAAWGGVDPARLLHQSCRRLSETEVRFLGMTFPETVLALVQSRVCPACLREDAETGGTLAIHGRLFWMLRSFRTCPRHGLAIRTLPSAGEGRARQDVIGDIRPLRQQILDGALDIPGAADAALEHHLLARLSGQPTTPWLDSLAPHGVARFSEALGTALHLGRDTRAEDRDEAALRDATPHGFAALAGGPEAVTAAFMVLRQRSGRPQDGPQARHGHLHHWFAAQGRRPEYAHLRELYREYLLDTWPFTPGTKLLGRPVAATRVHTVATAARQWGLPARQLRKVLAARGLVSPAGDPGLLHVETFRVEAAREVLDKLATSISRPEAMRRLGLTQNQLRLIEESGILPVLALGPGVKPRHDGRAVADLLARIETQVTGEGDRTDPNWQGLMTAARRAKTTVPDLLGRVLAGDIAIRRAPGGPGIAGLRLHVPDILGPGPTDTSLGRRTVAERLHLGEAVIAWLVSAGHLRCAASFIPGTRLRKFSFDPTEIEAFDRAHVSATALAHAWNLPLREVHRHLTSAGVEPVLLNPSGRVRIYRRQEAEAVRPGTVG